MHGHQQKHALIWAAALSLSLFGQVALADTMTLQFRSEHTNIVDVEFYSQNRNHVWPGNGEIYVLDNYEQKTMTISCHRGEKICYGAWVRNRTHDYWGAGYGGTQACDSCCVTCNERTAEVWVLNP